MEAAAAAACIISLSGIGERDVALSQIEYRLGIIPCPIFILFLLLRCGLSLPTSPDELLFRFRPPQRDEARDLSN